MPLFFFIFGAVLLDAGVLGNGAAFFKQLKGDVSGFLAFGVAILILGGLGISPTFRPVSKSLLVLVFVAFFLKNGKAIISQTVSTSETGSTANTATTSSSAATAPTSSSSSSSSSTNWGQYADDIFGAIEDYEG